MSLKGWPVHGVYPGGDGQRLYLTWTGTRNDAWVTAVIAVMHASPLVSAVRHCAMGMVRSINPNREDGSSGRDTEYARSILESVHFKRSPMLVESPVKETV
jgi:hypothetical protein